MTINEPARGYDPIADWYDEVVQVHPIYREMVLPGLLSMAGDVRGQSVCDLACGQGLIARALAKVGARVAGVDVSPRLLEIARAHEQRDPGGIRYVEDDAQTLATLNDASFDGATCSMALMNIPDLAACFSSVRRILRPGGWFVVAITHPCYQTPHSHWIVTREGRPGRAVSGYFDERFWRSDDPDSVRGRIGEYHRMLSTYLNHLADAGFTLERMAEPRATG